MHPDDRMHKPRKRNFKYGHEIISILAEIWKSAGYLWSSRLKSALPLWIPYARQRLHITPEIEKQLLSISSATIDRRLKNKKYQIKKKMYSCTRPGTLLKHQIPIKTDNWDINEPGFLEPDLVSHGGSSAEGDFIHSLNCTDIHTQWTETRAIMGKGQIPALEAIEEIKNSLPFKLKGIDPDNDGAFINYHLLAFCEKYKIQFTRSRPYKKNDNAHIEQKNWTHVRKIFGYVRYDTQEAQDAMNDLYRNELCWFMNFFLPSVKLIQKKHEGSKIIRKYDKPKTPFQRVCECPISDPVKVAKLKQLMQSLNPFELSETIDKKLDRIYEMRTKKFKFQRTYEERFNAELLKDLSLYKYI